jgi:hypothetical protein
MVAELEEVPMSIVGGLDIRREQLTFDYVEVETGRCGRGRIAPADRGHLAGWLSRLDGSAPVAFALEGCTGWRYVVEEMDKAGVQPHLAEPADTAAPRGTGGAQTDGLAPAKTAVPLPGVDLDEADAAENLLRTTRRGPVR